MSPEILATLINNQLFLYLDICFLWAIPRVPMALSSASMASWSNAGAILWRSHTFQCICMYIYIINSNNDDKTDNNDKNNNNNMCLYHVCSYIYIYTYIRTYIRTYIHTLGGGFFLGSFARTEVNKRGFWLWDFNLRNLGVSINEIYRIYICIHIYI